ncbi:MAG: hypothetical protein GC153_09780 [Alphaproteobacteria bacterium]|nr:hypothetical protein [Alphaproteobacteria bacterium]
MTRNWGLPAKRENAAFRKARSARPIATLSISALFGVIGAAIAAISFNEARAVIEHVFHGRSLIFAVLAAGFGCWAYVWIARPRFAAHFNNVGDAFSDLLKFYARAALALVALLAAAKLASLIASDIVSVLILCVSGGAAAAAAFQTVLAFVPAYEPSESA